MVRKKDKRRWESRTQARHKSKRGCGYKRKAGSPRWEGIWQLTNEAPSQQAQSPLPGEESEIGRDRGTDQTVTLVAIHSSVTEKRAGVRQSNETSYLGTDGAIGRPVANEPDSTPKQPSPTLVGSRVVTRYAEDFHQWHGKEKPTRGPSARSHCLQHRGCSIKRSRMWARIRSVFGCWSIGRSLTCFGRSEMKFAQLGIRPLLHRQYIVQWTD